jgi:glycosyltransferase involved in cell wall biosynthesis
VQVAQFIHRYPPALGGAEQWIARLSRGLTAQGDRVTVRTTTALDLSALWKKGHTETLPGDRIEQGILVKRFRPICRFPGRKYLLKPLSLLGEYGQLWFEPVNPIVPAMWRDVLSDPSPCDVVHVAAFPFGYIAACAERLAKRHKAPLVITPFLHLGTSQTARDYTPPALCRLLREANRVLVQTPTELEAVAQLGVERKRIVLQGLGVDPAECTGGHRQQARQRWGIPEEAIVVGHLANQSREKGTLDLLAAHQANPNFHLLLAGPLMPDFQRHWQASPLRPGLTQLGPLDDQEKKDFFAAIDLFAMPSLTDSFGLVFLEAWANGLPVIGYRAGGVADVIRHEKDGLLVDYDPANQGRLNEAMQRLVSNATLRTEYGQAGRDRLPIDFRWEEKIAIARETMRSI